MGYSEISEQTIIGLIVHDGMLVDELDSYCTAEDFFIEKHRKVIQSAKSLRGSGREVNLVTLSTHLAEHHGGHSAQWIQMLGNLAKNSVGSISGHARRIRDESDLRKLSEAAQSVLLMCADKSLESSQILDMAQSRMLNAVDRKSDTLKDSKQQIQCLVDDLEEKFNSTGIIGLHSGWDGITEKIGGMREGELITVAARPAMGKTNFALNLFTNTLKQGKSAYYVSLEMTSQELMGRIMSSLSEIDYGKFRDGSFDPEDWSKFTSSIKNDYHNTKSMIDDASSQTLGTIRASARRIQRQQGLDLVVVDHIGLIDQDGENETARISKVSRELKKLAKDLGCPIVAISQLNRACDQRTNKRPLMSDLRQSGSIEQDSDTVILLYRDEYYNEDSENKGIAEINIAKNRKGETGVVPLGTQFHFCRFIDTERLLVTEQQYASPHRGMNKYRANQE